MAIGARLLPLDEPSAGMNPKETAEITDIICRIRDERGYSILLVEHKMNLVGDIKRSLRCARLREQDSSRDVR
jgi:branched-chain amino acid transport system ATP-binding protein